MDSSPSSEIITSSSNSSISEFHNNTEDNELHENSPSPTEQNSTEEECEQYEDSPITTEPDSTAKECEQHEDSPITTKQDSTESSSVQVLSSTDSSDSDSFSRFNDFLENKEETASEKLEIIENCMASSDYSLIANTIKTIDSAVISSSVPEESIIPRKRHFSEISNDTVFDFQEYKKCSIYLSPNLDKLEDQFKNHLRNLRSAEDVIRKNLGLKKEEPQEFDISDYLITTDNLNYFNDDSMNIASRNPSSRNGSSSNSVKSFFEFAKPYFCKYSDDNLKYMVKMREKGLNIAFDLQNILKSADKNFEEQEYGSADSSETSVEKCCSYCLDFMKENIEERNDSMNVLNEKDEEDIKEQIMFLLEELKITNSKNNATKDKLTAHLVQTEEKVLLEERKDKIAKQMDDLLASQREKKERMIQKEIKRRVSKSSPNKLPKEVDSWLNDWNHIEDLLGTWKESDLDYQRLRSKKYLHYMNDDLIATLNKMLEDKYPGMFNKQKTVKEHLSC